MIDGLTKYTYKMILNILSSKESKVDGINFTRSNILAIQKLDDGSELYVIHTKEREGKYIVNPRNFPDQDGQLSDHSPLITARSDETPSGANCLELVPIDGGCSMIESTTLGAFHVEIIYYSDDLSS